MGAGALACRPPWGGAFLELFPKVCEWVGKQALAQVVDVVDVVTAVALSPTRWGPKNVFGEDEEALEGLPGWGGDEVRKKLAQGVAALGTASQWDVSECRLTVFEDIFAGGLNGGFWLCEQLGCRGWVNRSG